MEQTNPDQFKTVEQPIPDASKFATVEQPMPVEEALAKGIYPEDPEISPEAAAAIEAAGKQVEEELKDVN